MIFRYLNLKICTISVSVCPSFGLSGIFVLARLLRGILQKQTRNCYEKDCSYPQLGDAFADRHGL